MEIHSLQKISNKKLTNDLRTDSAVLYACKILGGNSAGKPPFTKPKD